MWISILEILCVPIFRQNGQLWIFGPKFAQKWILGSKFQKSKSGFVIRILEIHGAPIFRQNGQLWIFRPKFAQKWILGSEFQKSKSGFGINTSNIPCVPIFSQNGQLLIFWPKFGEIAQLRAIFWFKYCWGCYRELGEGWNELGGGWNELGGGRWSWVEVGALFSNTQINKLVPVGKILWRFIVFHIRLIHLFFSLDIPVMINILYEMIKILHEKTLNAIY